MYNHVYIIAEMSANHCGDINLAKKIISTAKEIGADAVKIQTYTADTMTIDCNNPEFIINDRESLWNGENLYSLYKKAYTPWEWQKELKEYADKIGIDFFSTPFDKTAVDFLESIDVKKYKIASFEAIDHPLVKYIARKHKPIIMSVGISTLEEIEDAIKICKDEGCDDLTILKCTSEYPAKLEHMNVNTISDLKDKFTKYNIKVGLSDHSMNIEPVIAAVSLGASVIEKHFTLDRKFGGADAGFSLNTEEFAEMIKVVRNTEKILGKPTYDFSQESRKFGRSLYVVKDIKKGEKLTEDNIRSIRPNSGLHTKFYDDVIGKKATKNLEFGKPLQQEDFK